MTSVAGCSASLLPCPIDVETYVGHAQRQCVGLGHLLSVNCDAGGCAGMAGAENPQHSLAIQIATPEHHRRPTRTEALTCIFDVIPRSAIFQGLIREQAVLKQSQTVPDLLRCRAGCLYPGRRGSQVRGCASSH